MSPQVLPQEQLQIDPAAIQTYCDVVFGYLEGLVPVRYIAEKGTPPKPNRSKFIAANVVAGHVIKTSPGAQEQNLAVYVVPCTVAKAGSAGKADIIATGVLVVDIDDGDTDAKREHLSRHLGEPTMIVASGGVTDEGMTKYHLYWRLSEAAEGKDLLLAVHVRALAARKSGSDASFAVVTQPIRVAGTVHGKYGNCSPVRLLSHSSVEYHLSDLAAAVDAMPLIDVQDDLSQAHTAKRLGPTAQDLMTKFIREGGKDEETRFRGLSMIIGHWIRMVRNGRATLGDAWIAVQQQNAATIQPPWDETRLSREFEAILQVDIENHGPMPVQVEDGTASLAAPEFSEDALAQEFVREFGNDWRQISAWGQWLRWTGTVWKRDTVGAAFESVRIVCRMAAIRNKKSGDMRRLASARTIQAVAKIAGFDPMIAIDVDVLDQHQMLLNTPDGMIDLETGIVGQHDRSLLITQATRASLGRSCPTWICFLETITNFDHELMAYLARVAGYCLTGSTKEQVFYLLHGSGANGKSVFLQTIAYVLGDYAATATPDSFTNRAGMRHLSEIAGLRGARMVLVSETEVDGQWAEARIKAVTGGERLRANFMYRDHFEFTPQFKLLVGTNHRPALGEVGEAMRRRLHLIPFCVTIPVEERDPDLADKLKAEADGILGWMLDGCHDWQQHGLRPPACVTAAAEEYFGTEDHFGHWIVECCQTGPALRAASKVLFASWANWAKEAGLDPQTSRTLGEQLRSRGFKDGKVGVDRGWHGLALATSRAAREME